MPRVKKAQHNSNTSPPQPCDAPFPYEDYVRARTTLNKALKGGCFYALLTGASGMGKTALLGELARGLDRHRYNLVYLASANINLVSIVRLLANRLRVGARRSYLETVDIIAETISTQPVHMLLWLDEADQLDVKTLHEIRTLAENKLDAKQLLTVIFSGLPELAQKIEAPALFPLRRRIARRCTLSGLRRDVLEPFILHRFGQRDAQRGPAQVSEVLFERSQGPPGLSDRVVRHALADERKNLDADSVRAILDNHGL